MTPLIVAPDVLIWIGLKPGKNRSVDPRAGRWNAGSACARAGGASAAAAEPSSIASDASRKSRRSPPPSAASVGFVLMVPPAGMTGNSRPRRPPRRRKPQRESITYHLIKTVTDHLNCSTYAGGLGPRVGESG